MIAYYDYGNSFTKTFYNQIFPEVKSKYIDTDNLLFVVKDYPLPFSTHAKEASNAANCIRKQSGDSGYFTFQQTLFSKQDTWVNKPNPEGEFLSYVQDLNLELNIGDFRFCNDTHNTYTEINTDISEANQAGVVGVPHFFINNQPISGIKPYGKFIEIIDGKLNP